MKEGEISHFPGDLFIDGEKVKYENIVRVLSEKNVKIVVAKSMPSYLISELRKNGIIYLKADNLEDVEDLNIDIKFEGLKIKRGAGCQRRFKG